MSEETTQILAELPSRPPESVESPYVFISYRSQEPDLSLAHKFSEEITKAGFKTFMAGESLRIGDVWPAQIDHALKECGYFLLLLSAESAASEMVMQEVRRAKILRETRPEKRPRIMPVRVKLSFEEMLNYDLDADLRRIQQLLWQSPTDTSVILQQILDVIATGEFEGPLSDGANAGLIKGRISGRRASDSPPLPVAEPEWPEGRVPYDSKFYVARPNIDTESFEYIMNPAALIRIRAPRQMGKTSLLARILNHASQRGCATGQISFQVAASPTFADLKTFLTYFCRRVGKIMGLPSRLAELWDPDSDPVENCWTYFTEYLLQNLERPFVLGLDETDRLFQHPEVAENFLGMLRGFMDGRDNDALWANFRVVLVHSTECYLTLSVNSSPFNIGRGFKLPSFTDEQMAILTQTHGLPFDNDARRLLELVNGHPYLTRLALYLVAHDRKSFAEIMEHAHTEAGPFSDHLRRHYWNLTQHPELLAAAKTVVAAQASAARAQSGARARVSMDSMPAFKLEGMGLVKPVENKVTISCEVYQRYFADRFGITT